MDQRGKELMDRKQFTLGILWKVNLQDWAVTNKEATWYQLEFCQSPLKTAKVKGYSFTHTEIIIGLLVAFGV